MASSNTNGSGALDFSGPDPNASPAATNTGTDIWGLSSNVGKSNVYSVSKGEKGPDGTVVDWGDSHMAPKLVWTPSTAQSWASNFAALSATNPNSFAQTQQELFNAGFYGSTPPSRPGVYGSADKAAFASALQAYLAVIGSAANSDQSAAKPLTFADFIDGAAQSGSAYLAQQKAAGIGGSSGGGSAPAPLNLTDPEQLKATLQSAAQAALHRNLDDSELSTFVSSFHGKEQAAYNSANGGATYTPPDIAGQAAGEITAQHKPEQQQALQASYLDTINSLLGVK